MKPIMEEPKKIEVKKPSKTIQRESKKVIHKEIPKNDKQHNPAC